MQADLLQPSHKRRKQATYGKSARVNNSWNVTSLDAFAANEQASPTQLKDRSTAFRDAYPVTKPNLRPTALQSVKARATKVETWDVPSSDDDEQGFSISRLKRPNLTTKRKIVEPVAEAFAPWEEKDSAEVSGTHRRHGSREIPGKSASISDDRGTAAAVVLQAASQDALRISAKALRGPQAASESTKSGTTASGAAARLQARKQLHQDSVSTRTGDISNSKTVVKEADHIVAKSETRPTRPKSTKSTRNTHLNGPTTKSLADASKHANEEKFVSRVVGAKQFADTGIKSTSKTQDQAPPRPTKRSKRANPVGHTRSPTQPALSAPARLIEMVEDLDNAMQVDFVASSGNQDTVQDVVLVHSPTTPTSNEPSSTISATRAGSLTPKRVHLWNQLLPDATIRATPASMALQNLTLQSSRSTKAPPTLVKSMSANEPKRQRLVDRLKASAAVSDSESSDDDTTDDEELPMEKRKSSSQQHASNQSQSQGQTTTTSQSGPKITYARTRSYIQESTFEESLLFEMPLQSPPNTLGAKRTAGRSNALSQQSEFDLGDSDEDGKAGGLRSIHELRAGGGNQRFLDDMGGMLDDISDHRISARSRRRSALFDLATRLADKAFAEKFLRLSYEQPLLHECGTAPDQIADYALLACLVSLLSEEVSQHTVRHVKDTGSLKWIAGFLASDTSPRQMARDRSNNMSKSAQDSFIEFSSKFAHSITVWGNHSAPSRLTARVLALKLFDQVIRRLRTSGDTAELVDLETIRSLTPKSPDEVNQSMVNNPDRHWDVDKLRENTLAISVLESLSSLTQSLTWPGIVIEHLADILVNTHCDDNESEQAQNFIFLLLRLSLNLTNDNSRNCKHFCIPAPIPHLLHMISTGFDKISKSATTPVPPLPSTTDEPNPATLDILVLAMGITINIAETTNRANNPGSFPGRPTPTTQPTIVALANTFRAGQQRTQAAESVEESITNVAFGYLAIVLACLCRDAPTRLLIASQLKGSQLAELIDAVQEFVVHHEQVDLLNMEDQVGSADNLESAVASVGGAAVWSAFTERLQQILSRLTADAADL